MPKQFPRAPVLEGLTFVRVEPVIFYDEHYRRDRLAQMYTYREDSTGDLFAVFGNEKTSILKELKEIEEEAAKYRDSSRSS